MNVRFGYVLDRNTLLKGYREREVLSKFHEPVCGENVYRNRVSPH